MNTTPEQGPFLSTISTVIAVEEQEGAMQSDITQADIVKARTRPDLMDAALGIKLQYTGSDLTAAIATLLVRLERGTYSVRDMPADEKDK
jgi:hypothetical protein